MNALGNMNHYVQLSYRGKFDLDGTAQGLDVYGLIKIYDRHQKFVGLSQTITKIERQHFILYSVHNTFSIGNADLHSIGRHNLNQYDVPT